MQTFNLAAATPDAMVNSSVRSSTFVRHIKAIELMDTDKTKVGQTDRQLTKFGHLTNFWLKLLNRN